MNRTTTANANDAKTNYSRKVGDNGSDVTVAAKARKPNGTQADGKKRGSKTQNESQKRHGHVIVIRIEILLREVVRVLAVEIIQEADLGGG